MTTKEQAEFDRLMSAVAVLEVEEAKLKNERSAAEIAARKKRKEIDTLKGQALKLVGGK